jgi:glycosyltransferase involved in cell wall biosynthesis
MMESSDPGGAERMLLVLLDRLDPARYRSRVLTWRDGWLNEEVRRRGIPEATLPLARPLDPACLRRLLARLAEWRVDLLHAHEFAMNTYGTIAARLARKPIVTTVHGKHYYGDRFHRRLAYRFVARAAFRMVAVSRDIGRDLVERVGVRPEGLVTIYNGVDAASVRRPGEGRRLRRDLGIAETAPVVGAIGNLLPVKGHVYLIQAAARLAREWPDLTVLLCGRPVLRADLEAEAARLGVAGRIRFLGFRDDVGALLDALDVFVLPSLSEGLSLALVEAMAAGTPVAATAVGGNPELIRDGETGLLVPPRDPDALAAAIGRLLADRPLAGRLAAAARAAVGTTFAAETMVSRYEALYAEMLGR